MSKSQKILIAAIYFISLALILYGFFSFIDLSQISNYSYIQEKSQILIKYKSNNLLLFIFVYFIFSIIWILLLGFASPLALISGFIFGKYFGTIISVVGFSLGCTLLYVFANMYLRDYIVKYISHRISNIIFLFKKNEFLYFLIFRFAGGGGIPFAIQNVLPVVFNMKTKNYFNATIIGLIPSTFILNSLGSGIEEIIETNEDPTFFSIITDPNIYLPLIGFIFILLISSYLKIKIFKKENKI
tara:strand:+ start:438 stop:1166 length:729 start_codon:yes stop_codon:yes gene_type:complete